MKILHTSDWHLGAYVGPQCDDPYKRMENTIKCLDVLVNTAKKEEPDIILETGDIFHTAKSWSDRCNVELRTAANYIERLKECAPVAVLYGTPNHDNLEMFNNLIWMCTEGTEGSYDAWFFAEPELCTIPTKSGPIQVAGLPGFDKGYFRAKFPGLSAEDENKLFTQQLSSIVMGLSAKADSFIPSVLITHHTVAGCDLDNGQNSIFLQNEVLLDANTLDNSGFDLVCLGHIHKAQRVKLCNKPVFYTGSLDAWTFNDEEHKKGFYMHDINGQFIDHKFYETPAMQFKTLKLDESDLKTCIAMTNPFHSADGKFIKDMVVRVLYTCDDATEKALDKKKLERDLYAAGAYYVKEISPEKITASVNREALHEKLTVEDCLTRYMNEKHFEYDEDIIYEAQSIIAKIQSALPSGSQTGLFLPLEIEVRNYRSYAVETFSFEQIYFAMVNGVNGSGKSSLFMDAIVDCLYEQPREGDLTGWVKNDERSGSISFTFMLGDETYRVTRTRQRSGKATLAIAKLEGLGEGMSYNKDFPLNWDDISCQKLVDTQQKIVDLLGMDADTFRSCVLIMQDQYGKFMEARPEDRMAVLSNLLGLGIYEDLEAESKELLRETNRSIKEAKIMMMDLEEDVKQEEPLSKELETLNNIMDTIKCQISDLRESRDVKITKVRASEKASEELELINKELANKQNSLSAKKEEQRVLNYKVDQTKEFLSQEDDIKTNYSELQTAREWLFTFEGKLNLLRNKEGTRNKLENEYSTVCDDRQSLEKQIAMLEVDLKEFDKVAAAVAELDDLEKQLNEIDDKFDQWQILNENLNSIRIKRAKFESDIERCEIQVKILENSNCIDINQAKCNFLKAAKEAVSELEKHKVGKINAQKVEAELLKSMIETGYSSEEYTNLKQQVNELKNKKTLLETLKGKKQAKGIYTNRLVEVGQKQKELQDNINDISIEINKLSGECAEVGEIKKLIENLIKYEEQYQQLPVAKQFMETTEYRINELNKTISELTEKVLQAYDKTQELQILAEKYDSLKQELSKTESLITGREFEIQSCNQKIGTVTEKLSSIATKKRDLQNCKSDMKEMSEKAARLEFLVDAFSQEGIPHQIIRDIVPELEAAANEILSKMTGGKMRVEFRTEKTLKSNRSKEVATLDIVINDIEHGELPYLSRSGGQRVRAALAVSFALAMIKASRVGLQLGLLFVDEPPYLDAEGTEAYCAALQFIHEKYPDMRIVAISHDENMKSRFPQQITVDITEIGSKVRIA